MNLKKTSINSIFWIIQSIAINILNRTHTYSVEQCMCSIFSTIVRHNQKNIKKKERINEENLNIIVSLEFYGKILLGDDFFEDTNSFNCRWW